MSNENEIKDGNTYLDTRIEIALSVLIGCVYALVLFWACCDCKIPSALAQKQTQSTGYRWHCRVSSTEAVGHGWAASRRTARAFATKACKAKTFVSVCTLDWCKLE